VEVKVQFLLDVTFKVFETADRKWHQLFDPLWNFLLII